MVASALECAEEMHLELPGLTLAKRLYDQLSARGMEDCGTGRQRSRGLENARSGLDGGCVFCTGSPAAA